MSAQVQNEHMASTNRAQYAHGNQSHPASLAVSRPLAADRNVHAPAALPQPYHMATQQRSPVDMHSTSAQPGSEKTPARNLPVQNPNNEHKVSDASKRNEVSRPAPAQQASRETAPQRQEVPSHPMTAQHQTTPQQHQTVPEQRQAPAAKSRPEEHPKM
jgi:hypothetical protein